MRKTIQRIDEADVTHKHVLVRVDFNVPLDKSGNILDDKRIADSLPTIRYLLDHDAKVVLMSHLGRPVRPENIDPSDPSDPSFQRRFRMDAVASRLSELLMHPVKKLDDCIGRLVENEVASMDDGDLILLENLRFHPGEEANDPLFAKKLSRLGEVYCNDAFAVSHRAHASISAITSFLPGYAGFLLDKEVSLIGKALHKPERPFVAMVGGLKLATKIPLIKNLLGSVDHLLIGGAMMFTFLKARGLDVGASLVDDTSLALARDMLREHGERLVLPVDVAVARELTEQATRKEVPVEAIPSSLKGFDVGEKTVVLFKETLSRAKTIIWNGPLGAFETPPFDYATHELAHYLASLSSVRIIGGGDTASAVASAGVAEKMTHISTGGGASLVLFSGQELVGLEALREQKIEGC
ncbi:MAG: phosphoglycerate kinase [DPANN group archaeon]|nr:phosphoglycerate kinase [DPANN group archaeon]